MNARQNNVQLLDRPQEVDAPRPRSILVLCMLTLGLGSAISIGAFFWLKNDALSDARLQFERHASDAHHSIEARIMSYTDIVYGLRALVYSTDHLSRRQFHNYVSGLNV